MRHRRAGKHLGRTSSHRKALWRNMAASLFQHGAIRTTEVKAKQLRRFAEKLITIAKKGDLHARRRVIQILQDRDMYTFDKTENDYVAEDKTVVQKLFDEIAPRYAERDGGYTRIIRVAERRVGDAGVQVILQLVEEEAATGKATGGSTRRKARAEKRRESLKALGLLGGKKEAPAAEVVEEEAPAAEEAPVEEAPAEEVVADQAEEPKAEEGEEKAE